MNLVVNNFAAPESLGSSEMGPERNILSLNAGRTAQDLPEWTDLEPIGQYLRRLNYSKHFIDLFLIPMCAAPWCIDPQEFASSFPAMHLIRFM